MKVGTRWVIFVGAIAALPILGSIFASDPGPSQPVIPASAKPLTAEHAFAVKFEHGTFLSGGVNVGPPTDDGFNLDWLSPDELKKYQARVRAGELNDVILFYGRCIPTPVGSPKFEAFAQKWRDLPDQLRSELGDFEVKEVNASQGGWPEFCRYMRGQMQAGMYDFWLTN